MHAYTSYHVPPHSIRNRLPPVRRTQNGFSLTRRNFRSRVRGESRTAHLHIFYRRLSSRTLNVLHTSRGPGPPPPRGARTDALGTRQHRPHAQSTFNTHDPQRFRYQLHRAPDSSASTISALRPGHSSRITHTHTHTCSRRAARPAHPTLAPFLNGP